MLRYSALALGVFYGFTHQRTINATQRAAAAKKEYEHKQQLIEKARAEYAKSKNPALAASEKSPCTFSMFSMVTCESNRMLTVRLVNQDPMDPNFDLEAYFNALAAQNP